MERGGSGTDSSTAKLDSSGGVPSQSNQQQKEGALKRHGDADLDNDESAEKKMKVDEPEEANEAETGGEGEEEAKENEPDDRPDVILPEIMEQSIPLTRWVIRFVRWGAPNSIFPHFQFKICGFRPECEDNEWGTSAIIKVVPPYIMFTSSSIYRLDGQLDVDQATDMGFPPPFITDFLMGFPDDWEERLENFFNKTFGPPPQPRIVEVMSVPSSTTESEDDDDDDETKEVKQEEEVEDVKPPVAAEMNACTCPHCQAWVWERIGQWVVDQDPTATVEDTPYEREGETEGDEAQALPEVEKSDCDDEVVGLEDEDEMDSVSHSGLQLPAGSNEQCLQQLGLCSCSRCYRAAMAQLLPQVDEADFDEDEEEDEDEDVQEEDAVSAACNCPKCEQEEHEAAKTKAGDEIDRD